VKNPTTWFQLRVIRDAGPEITNGLGACLREASKLANPPVDRFRRGAACWVTRSPFGLDDPSVEVYADLRCYAGGRLALGGAYPCATCAFESTLASCDRARKINEEHRAVGAVKAAWSCH